MSKWTTDPSSPQARLEGARKQLRLALEAVDDPTTAARIQDAHRALRDATDRLASDPALTATTLAEDTTGVELVECINCGRTGLPERIHPTACPHDGSWAGDQR